jgi:hypothetical protein
MVREERNGMKRFILLLALFVVMPAHAQQPSRAPSTITVAPYGQAVLSSNGQTTWQIYAAATGIKPYVAGNDFVFTAAPGTYLVVGSNASGSTTLMVTFEAPGGVVPTPAPTNVSPSPTPVTPVPPTPAPANGDFIYPTVLPPTSAPSTTGFSASVARAAKGSPGEAKVLSLLYYMVAAEIELDGRLATPRLSTFKQANDILKKEKSAFLGMSPADPLTAAFPAVTSLASTEFARTGIKENSPLTPAVRSNYVSFLRQLANGFDLAAGVPLYSNLPPANAQ